MILVLTTGNLDKTTWFTDNTTNDLVETTWFTGNTTNGLVCLTRLLVRTTGMAFMHTITRKK